MPTVVDAKRPPAPPGASNALAAPLGPDGALRTVGPFAMVAHHKSLPSPPGSLPVDADVRPHPHIGLAAISYILDGAVTHRDSLGNRHELRPGEVGTTLAGRGVVHSERFDRNRLMGSAFEMFQLLLALPDGSEEVEPAFFVRSGQELATATRDGATERWLFASPPAAPVGLPTATPILLADVTLEAGARWSVPVVPERALYVLHGEIELGGSRARAGQVAIVDSGAAVVDAVESARLLAFGGTSVGVRYMWWNYLHSSLERIEAAKADWRSGRVQLPSGDTESFTPCPPDNGRPLLRLNG